MLFCGKDTSNYTTSAAVVDGGGRVIANLRAPLPVGDGDRGLRQSDAVFAHVRNLPGIMEKLGEFIDGSVAAVGVSYAPRTAEGSYMPCFLCGIAAAQAFASGRNIPVMKFSHQQGHIMASYYTSGAVGKIGGGRFIAFHVSGGTTELLLTDPCADFSVELIGGTDDLNAGQAIDRTGVRMGLHFPCGPRMEELALGYTGKTEAHPVSVRGTHCSLSGLENLALKMKDKGANEGEISAFVFDYVGRTLEKLAVNARETYGNLPVVFAGGVMSNSIIKNRLSRLENVFFTEPCFSADNAVGTALLCRRQFLKNEN